LELEIAPGMPNPELVADFRDASGMEMLMELGPRFGFTAFNQGDNRVLIIPALDAGTKTEAVSEARSETEPPQQETVVEARVGGGGATP
jgi:hypothetical protein